VVPDLYFKHRIEQQIPAGLSRSRAQSKMSSLGFVCAIDNPKSFDASIGQELFCLKKEEIGPGVANKNWRFLLLFFPSLYAFVPKDASPAAMYRRSEVVLVLKDDAVSSVRVNTRLQ
jgi:hypothetical protein